MLQAVTTRRDHKETSMPAHDLALFGRVALSAGLGFAVGWEREVRGHPAGSRTFALVAAGSASFTAIAIDAFPSTAEKLIAGIVTGIGFIGAGIVLRDPAGHVRGLTTAAAIWSIASVGVVAGAGRFVLATLVALLFLVVLEIPNLPLLRQVDPTRWARHFETEYETLRGPSDRAAPAPSSQRPDGTTSRTNDVESDDE
jgi:putative Mg2+ transporter-C (MgtC) family protein